MARRHPQVWLDTTNVFGSIELAPEPARAGLLDKVADLFDAAPDRIFFGTDYPAAMGSLAELPGQIPPARAEQMAANAARFVNESFGLDLERAQSSKVH
jgi:predicted TIM-barrel fold metal-dependent hydrolase